MVFGMCFGRLQKTSNLLIMDLNTTCPDCDCECSSFEILEQNGGIELWIYCENCEVETFRLGNNMLVENLIAAK